MSKSEKAKSNLPKIILGVVLLVAAIYGFNKYRYVSTHEDTDNAQVETYFVPVLSRAAGYVKSVHLNDFEEVKKGDTLIVIDNSDYLLKVQQAEAALEAAKSGFEASKSTYQSTTANTASAEASVLNVNAQIEAASAAVRERFIK